MKIKEGATPKVKIKNFTENPTRPYAYDKHGNYWSLEDAISNNQREWYLDKNQKIPLILVNQDNDNPKTSLHWRIKRDVEFTHNGIKLNTSNFTDESVEHLNFKKNIIEQGFFFWNDYKIFIKNAKDELIIYDGYRFRSDVLGSMLDGTPIFVEVVKTSEVSDKKKEFINKNELTTFVLYIDKNGNQINNKFNIIGNKEIEQIKESIQKGEGKISDFRKKCEEQESKYRQIAQFKIDSRRAETERVEEEHRRIEEEYGYKDLREQIQRSDREIIHLIDDIQRNRNGVERIQREIEEFKANRIVRIDTEADRIEEQIKSIKDEASTENITEAEVLQIKARIKQRREQFKEASKYCQVKWFTPKWMGDTTINKFNDLKYWTS